MRMRRLASKELTQEEFNVAYLVAHGLPVKQAAARNNISMNAATHRMKRVYKKLNVWCNTDLAKALEKKGYSDAPYNLS